MKKTPISSFFRKEIISMSAYKVAEAKGYIKLDAMENPYTWPDKIKEEWLDELKPCLINRYPDPEAKQLVRVIRETNNIPEQSGVILGNGSDEIIQILLMALSANSTVLSPSPGFVMYKQIALSLGLNFHSVPLLAENFELDLPLMLSAIKEYSPSIIFLAFPNNPTGNLFVEDEIETILKEAPGLVIVDEAYAPFAGTSFLNKLSKYSNLLVMRTVSKLGLAGLRLGYIVGARDITEQLNKIRLPYNINILTQLTAEFSLKHQALFDQQTQKICIDRALVLEQLNDFSQIEAYDSSANFILFKTQENQANLIFDGLKERGILIKNLSPQGGALTDCLRVTIGKPKENKMFIDALSEILS
ncbi:MAG: histidinol-phosphate transaminase [Methylococcales bacterium]|nr:histidinol-phosphate transaminase [Methylococcales bacterium]